MLTDAKIKRLRFQEGQNNKHADSNGLYLEVRKTGAKFFRYRFRFNKKEQTLTFGEYPAVTLANARLLRDDARVQVLQGLNPIEEKRQAVQAIQQQQLIAKNRKTFEQVASLWLDQMYKSKSYDYVRDISQRLDKHLLPKIGALYVDEITTRQLIQALKQIEQTGRLETLRRMQQYANKIFLHAIGFGYCDNNPVGNIARDLFDKPIKSNYAHTTDRKTLAQVLRALESYQGDISTLKALTMQPYVFLRSRELAGLRWDEIDLDQKAIEISAERMKKKRPHLVPITPQVLEVIEYMRPISGDCDYVFPSGRTKQRPLNEQSLNAAMHRLGLKDLQTFHGFRHTASTLLNEMGFASDYIEKQLAHEQGGVRSVYNKAEYWQPRFDMMTQWGNFLDSLKRGENVIPLHAIKQG
ncbi:tyrosine-type recombinase/integrase [Thiomicrospira microaerophila]|uniref:tyrosine-type recombinase/integrase n=1 Tax=Thiomicrospira microaerophila TaxID=406020 RepID=UPI00200C9D61|nr:integrase arm-type DNA-binding domain-containing protein [Thiomicrospira microaerophila]UQB42748.1 tyrosine-type recombinase/integrase [Thiomicrospira microaerophila]